MRKWGIQLYILLWILALSVIQVWAVLPTGPVITYKGNTTSSNLEPTAEDNTSIRGGVIATIDLEARQQTSHYKAYVGNVSGSYVLEDADNYSIYEWSISSFTGEVYATRYSSIISWGGVECANAGNISTEMTAIHQNTTNTPDDNLTSTFSDTDHSSFSSGGTSFSANECSYSLNPYLNDTTQTQDIFENVLLQDASNNIIYVAEIETNLIGYRSDNTTYDFMMIVAENASSSWASALTYYFYVELT